MLDKNIKENIRSRLDIVDIISRYVSLKPAGKSYKGLCPFHKDKSPSFMVDPSKGVYHCFGCQRGGDVFSFLMEMEGVDFPEVLRMTAKETGIKLNETTGHSHKQNKDTLSKSSLYNVYKFASEFYYNEMKNNSKAIDYFKSRGISAETVKEFRLGFAPAGWSNLTDSAKKAGISSGSLVKSGLAIEKKENGRVYDRFRERIMFPVFDMSGRVIAFGGRGLALDSQPKYLNSPESPVFSKSSILYGFHKSRTDIRRENSVIIIEGYTDFLSLFQAGVKNCAATCGTALTPSHGNLIRRFSSEVILLFDGDEAGVNAAVKAVSVLIPFSLETKVCLLPKGEDPDSFISVRGKEPLMELIKKADSGIDFLIDKAILKHGIDSPFKKSRVITYLKPVVELIQDTVISSEIIKTISEKLNLSAYFVNSKLGKRQEKNNPVTNEDVDADSYFGTLESNLIKLLIHYPFLVDKALKHISPEILNDETTKKLYFTIIDTFKNDDTLNSLLDYTDDVFIKKIFSHHIMIEHRPSKYDENAENDFYHTVKRLKIKSLKEELRSIRKKQKTINKNDIVSMRKLQQQHKEILLKIKELNQE